MTTNLLITGSTGLLGSRFIDWILTNIKDVFIISIDNMSGGLEENLIIDDRILFLRLDLTDRNEQKIIEEEFKNRQIHYVYNFAAYAAEALSPFIRQYNYINNLIPTAFLVNMCVKYNVKRFVFTSSMATFGNSDGILPFSETSPRVPIDSYGIAKLACEMDIKVAAEQHGLEYCIILPHNIFGKGQNIFDPFRNFIGICLYKVLNNQDITIYGTGEQTRAFTYIDDILPCLWKAGTSSKARNETINLGGTKEYSIKEAAEIVMKVTNTNKVVYLEPRHEVKHAFCTYQKSIDLLDYKETKTLKEGIEEFFEWSKKLKMRPRKHIREITPIELEQGLYSYWK